MTDLVIDYDYLRKIDEALNLRATDQYEREIESIVGHLWNGIGKYEQLFSPLFTTFLQTNLLRPLYIYFFALKELKNRYEKIHVTASTIIIDIIANYLGIELSNDRSNHDEEFFLVRNYSFNNMKLQPIWKRLLKFLYSTVLMLKSSLEGVEVLYLNAGKLNRDFKKIPRALSASHILLSPSSRLDCDVRSIRKIIQENIQNMRLSIPNKLVLELVERQVIDYLPTTFNRIGSLAEFIERHGVKLVIASAATHEEHLCLLAAARLVGVDSLVIGHGHTALRNPFLDNYVTYQGTINSFEYKYKGAQQFPLKMEWF